MSPKPQNASAEVLDESLGSLNGCFVDGDVEQRKRAKRIRRRALAISISLQSLILLAVVLVPLFAKPEPLVYAYVTPIPPYGHYHSQQERSHTLQRQQHSTSLCFTCAESRPIPTNTHDESTTADNNDDGPTIGDPIPGGTNDLIPLSDARNSGPKPVVTETHVEQPHRVHLSEISPAMLVHRVEPVYPPLGRQIHKEGKVELHALIGTDGTIQSLQVVAGDALFVQSSLDAVTQWRYRPTTLNGIPVEVDTHITVVYTLAH